MLSERAGSHSFTLSDDSMSSYYTFEPTPICKIEIKPDEELLCLLANTQREIGLLEGSCRYIGSIENIINLVIKKEAIASCKIDDNNRLSILDLLMQPKQRSKKIKPVQNHIDALNYGVDKLKSTELSNKIIFSAHKILMEHKHETEIIGAVRKKQTIIGDYMVTIKGTPTYNPPDPDIVEDCMVDIQNYIKREDSIDALIKTALLHYQLEVVHPFESGNGKIGRIVIALFLQESKILSHAMLPISEFLEINKVEYFDRLKAVYNSGNYEQWIKFFLTMLFLSANIMNKQIGKAMRLRKKNLGIIDGSAKDKKYLNNAYHYAEKTICFDVASLADGIGVSYNTAARVARIMTDAGILNLLKEQTRNKIYLYSDLLDVMEIMN